jgi:hypothetical protein
MSSVPHMLTEHETAAPIGRMSEFAPLRRISRLALKPLKSTQIVYTDVEANDVPAGRGKPQDTCSKPARKTAMWLEFESFSPAPDSRASSSTTRELRRLHPDSPWLAEPEEYGGPRTCLLFSPAITNSHASPAPDVPVFWIENLAENPPGP